MAYDQKTASVERHAVHESASRPTTESDWKGLNLRFYWVLWHLHI